MHLFTTLAKMLKRKCKFYRHPRRNGIGPARVHVEDFRRARCGRSRRVGANSVADSYWLVLGRSWMLPSTPTQRTPKRGPQGAPSSAKVKSQCRGMHRPEPQVSDAASVLWSQSWRNHNRRHLADEVVDETGGFRQTGSRRRIPICACIRSVGNRRHSAVAHRASPARALPPTRTTPGLAIRQRNRRSACRRTSSATRINRPASNRV